MKQFKKLLLSLGAVSLGILPIVATQCNHSQTNNDTVVIPPSKEDNNNDQIKQLSSETIQYARTNLLSHNEIVQYKPLLDYLNHSVEQIDALAHNSGQNKAQSIEFITGQETNFKAMSKVFSNENTLDLKIKEAWMNFNHSLDNIVKKSNFILNNDLKLDASKQKYQNFIQEIQKQYADKRFNFVLNKTAEDFNQLYNDAINQYKFFMKDNLPKDYVVLLENRVADGDTIYNIFLGQPNDGQDISSVSEPLVVKEAKHQENLGKILGLRFRGIDTPETFKNKPEKDSKLAPLENEYAQKAKHNLIKILNEENWVFYIHKTGIDPYGRWVTFLFSNSNRDFATEFGVRQVQDGLARVWYIDDQNKKSIFYTKTQLEEEYYKYIVKVQNQAQSEKKGFWAENINDVFHVK
ncbi:thermonuclease family protein [Mycoplasma sp. 2634B]|uniref:thermonuclease family protein n=1 Tax=Mycoplasma sp. 2634B TaxID=3401692 RepID=UPI003AAB472E